MPFWPSLIAIVVSVAAGALVGLPVWGTFVLVVVTVIVADIVALWWQRRRHANAGTPR